MVFYYFFLSSWVLENCGPVVFLFHGSWKMIELFGNFIVTAAFLRRCEIVTAGLFPSKEIVNFAPSLSYIMSSLFVFLKSESLFSFISAQRCLYILGLAFLPVRSDHLDHPPYEQIPYTRKTIVFLASIVSIIVRGMGMRDPST